MTGRRRMRLSVGIVVLLIVGCCLTGAKPAAREKRAPATVKSQRPQPPAQPMPARFISQEEQHRVREAGLARWKPGPEEREGPMAAIRHPTMEVAGQWSMSGLFRDLTESTLTIRPSGAGGYLVEFSTRRCLGRWELKRTAHFIDGVLELDRPVAEYLPRVYRKLHAVKVAGFDLLVPAPTLKEFQAALSKDGRRVTGYIRLSCYGRVATNQAQN